MNTDPRRMTAAERRILKAQRLPPRLPSRLIPSSRVQWLGVNWANLWLFHLTFYWFRSVESVLTAPDSRYVAMSERNLKEVRHLRFPIWGPDPRFNIVLLVVCFTTLPLPVITAFHTVLDFFLPLAVMRPLDAALSLLGDMYFSLAIAQYFVWIAAGPQVFYRGAILRRRPSDLVAYGDSAVRTYLIASLFVAAVIFCVLWFWAGTPAPYRMAVDC